MMIDENSIKALCEEYPKVPEHTIGGLKRYVEKRITPGEFLIGILTNDLQGAIGHADSHNQKAIVEIVQFCHWQLPLICWGSPEKVKEYLENKKEGDTKDE